MDYDKYMPELIRLLDDKKYWVRVSALFIIDDVIDENFGEFEAFYNDDNVNEREKVIVQIKNWWKKNKNRNIIDVLIEDLKNGNTQKRLNVINKLCNYNNPRVVEALKLYIANNEIKYEVIVSLVKLKEYCYIENLIEVNLKSKDKMIKTQALYLLYITTKENLGFDVTKSSNGDKEYKAWKKWWLNNKNKYCIKKK